jgi:membrane protease YdiL (CAAX protease family)
MTEASPSEGLNPGEDGISGQSLIDPYRAPEPIPALARFAIAALWAAGVFWASGYVYTILPGHHLIPDLLFRIFALVLTAGGFAFFLRVFDYDRGPLLLALGLPWNGKAGSNLVAGFSLGAFLITADVGAIALIGSLHFQFHLSHHMALRAAGGTAVLLAGAILEELAFRGYPFQKLVQSFGAFWAVLVLSALFGAGHLGNPSAGGWLSWGFFNTLAVGVMLALARLRSGSLWFSIGLHFSWNFVEGTVFGLPVSGLRDFVTVVHGTAAGPRWLTGGAYGPEASAICMVVMVAAVPLLLQMTERAA